MKEKYIDLIEIAMDAYTAEHIKKYCENTFCVGITEHGFPRLTSNLGILISHGRKTEYKEIFKKMMDFCCKEIPIALIKNPGIGVGNDFSVKEIIWCILEIEKAGIFEKNVTAKWRDYLKKINPYKTYNCIASVPPKRIGNWAAFTAASEQVRKYAGLGDESAFIENQIQSQLLSFDENGMYRDPDEPMVYDLVTRLQLMAALRFGYDGEGKKELIKNLIKSADVSLKMLSTTGEFPFGGRSNQFIHNETFYAAACEFYASFFKKTRDVKRAGMFKRAARLAIGCAWGWLLSDSAIHHVKNYYPTDSLYGCEKYAYFDKYMITAGSWAYIAYLMADDSIEEAEDSLKNNNYVFKTSNYFHKVFCKFGNYFAEFDTKADPHYDGSGLGRFHKRGLPSALCLSVPFAKIPNYLIDIENLSGLSICGGIKKNDEYICSCNSDIKYTLIKKEITDDFLRVKFDCGGLFKEIYTISDHGLKIEVCGDGDLILNLPVFEFDGKDHTDITVSQTLIEVFYKNGKCRYVSDKKIEDTTEVYANRNGHYRRFVITGKNNIFINIILEHI